MKKRGRIVLIVLLSIVGGMVIIIVAATMSFGIPKQDYRVGQVDLSGIPDGTYIGEYKIVPPFGTFVGNKRVKVQVDVAQGKIQRITVVSPTTIREYLAPLALKVIEKQSPDVDVVGGATWTPRAFLKAVETALKKR